MPETFPKSHSAQFNLKYLQVKSNLILSSKTDNTITITALNPFFFSPKQEATLRESTVEGKNKRRRRANSEAKTAQLKFEKQPLFLMVFISYS